MGVTVDTPKNEQNAFTQKYFFIFWKYLGSMGTTPLRHVSVDKCNSVRLTTKWLMNWIYRHYATVIRLGQLCCAFILGLTRSVAIAKKADRTAYTTYEIAAEPNRRHCKKYV